MRTKILFILILCAAVFASLIVGTLSAYTAVSGFSTTISPDFHKVKQQRPTHRSQKKTFLKRQEFH
ncbi:MAG: hypothetical protein AWM53_01565 [Candidatus Dichloromethanomonas elyunquensis]|nr:MAG: hypothetical protein AWM53_01565 [Candidatus Dichloromethanomonas elyunquensis]